MNAPVVCEFTVNRSTSRLVNEESCNFTCTVEPALVSTNGVSIEADTDPDKAAGAAWAASPTEPNAPTNKAKAVTEATRPELPDHLSIEPSSPFYAVDVLRHDIGVRFNDKERQDVEEYCISEGWIKVPAGKTLDRKGKPLLLKLKGRVEVFYR